MAVTNYNTSPDNVDFDKLLALLQQISDNAESMGQNIVNYTDNELAAIKTELDLLDEASAVAAIAKFEAFLAANDADVNNVIDSLPAISSAISDYESRIAALEADKVSQDAAIANLQTTQASQGSSISQNSTDISALEARMTAEENKTDNVGIDEATARTIAVEQDRELLSQLGAKFEAFGVSLAAMSFTGSYPITGENGGGNPPV